MHVWILLVGEGDVALRIPSTSFGILVVHVSYLLGREIGGRKLDLAVASLVAVSPINIRFSQIARAYTLLALTVDGCDVGACAPAGRP